MARRGRYYILQDGEKLVSDSLTVIKRVAQRLADATGKGVLVGQDDGPFANMIAGAAKPARKAKAKARTPLKRTALKRGKPLTRKAPMRRNPAPRTHEQHFAEAQRLLKRRARLLAAGKPGEAADAMAQAKEHAAMAKHLLVMERRRSRR